MIAEKYFQRRSQIFAGGLLTGIVLAFAVFLFVVIHSKLGTLSLGYGALAAIAVYIIPIALANIWQKRFAREHPEMQFVWDWLRVGGEFKDYPTDEKDQTEVEDVIYRMLLDRAMAADVAMQIRDRVKTTNPCPALSEYGRTLKDLSARADYLNQRYLSFWDLVVVKMGHLSPLTNPREFRESRSKKMYE